MAFKEWLHCRWVGRILCIISVIAGLLCLLYALNGGPIRKPWLLLTDPRPLLLLLMVSLSARLVFFSQPASIKRNLAKLVLCCISSSFALVGLEMAMRLFFQQTQGFNSMQQLHNPNPVGNLHTRSHHPLLVITRFSDEKRLIYELKPDLDMLFGDLRLRTNANGLRADRDIPHAKPAGVMRIVGVGDSGMWGWGTEQNQGYLDVLERELKAAGHAVECLNMAVPGYNTYQEYVMLETRGLAYEPDIVIIGWCDNDFQLPFFMYTRKNHLRQKGVYVYRVLFDRPAFMELITPEVLKISDMPEGMIDPELIAHSEGAGVKETFHKFERLARKHGFKIVLFGPLNDHVIAMAREAGLYVINSYDLAERNPPKEIELFFMHPRPEGHEWLGKYLAERIQAENWLR